MKDPTKRLRDMGDARIEIDAIDEVVPGLIAATPLASAKRRAPWLPWVAAAAVVVAVLVWPASRAPIVQDAPLSNGQFSRFTDWEGVEFGAEISPDGRFVAFKADRDGQLDLWVSQVGTGRFLNLTQDIAPLGPPAILRNFGFSGDGAEIWFAEGDDSAAPKWLTPLTGGTPRPFMGYGPAAPSWSRDDTRLAYFSNGGGDPISIADRTSANARPLVIDQQGFFASGVHNHNPVWSPDGRWLYFAHGLEPTEEMNVWRVPASGGTPEQLTTLQAAANHLALLDDSTLLYVARADDRSGPWLWSLHVETKVARRVTSGLEHYTSVSASRDGRRVVTTVSNQTATLWQVPILDQPAGDREVQPYRLPRARALSPRFSKQALFYLSGQGAGDSLWRFQEGISSEVWKSAGDSLSEPAAVSPDGTRVAIIVRQDGKLRLSVMATDGTNARTLAPSIVIQGSGGRGSADWSPDGAWIVVPGTDAAGAGLFKIPLDGQAPVRLVSGQVVNPVWSPDGTLIVYGGPVVGGRVPLLGVRPNGTPYELPDVRTGLGGGHRFLPDGKGLVYLSRTQSRDFWLLDLATNRTRALTRLSNPGVVSAFDITPDGKAIVFDRLRDDSDIVLIDLPR
jgi:Tol biopolymer transport system component